MIKNINLNFIWKYSLDLVGIIENLYNKITNKELKKLKKLNKFILSKQDLKSLINKDNKNNSIEKIINFIKNTYENIKFKMYIT